MRVNRGGNQSKTSGIIRFKKSQITLFIIIGLIILIVLALLLLLKNYINQMNIIDSIESSSDKTTSYSKYHAYVESCVDQATKKGLFLIGMQGGVIYDYQMPNGKTYLGPSNGYPYGKYILPYNVDGVIYNVSYGLRMSQLGSTYHPFIPFYPYGYSYLISNPRIIDSRFSNLYGNFPGDPPLTPLCDYYGQNRQGSLLSVSCERYDSPNPNSNNSIQEYLEMFIEDEALRCISLERLPELSEKDIIKGNVTANVTFGENHVFVDVQLPIKIKLNMFKSVIQIQDFHVMYRVRLKKIYELVSHIIERDVNNIFFNMVSDAPTMNDCRDITGGNAICFKPGMKIKKIRNVCYGTGNCTEGNYDDILIVEDRGSYLEGIPYVFQVAIKNRPPALDLIRDEVGTGSYDYIVYLGDEIVVDPKGFDPDEDQHNSQGFMDFYYDYGEWKQDYDEIFKWSDCPNGPLTDESCLNKIYNDPLPPPNNWTKSNLYKSTNRSASYLTNKYDLGVHKLKVKVCDEDPNSCDWQIVVIFVLNGTFASGYNEYGIPGYASYEDPYFLTSPVTGEALDETSSCDKYKYIWTVKDEDGHPIRTDVTYIENLSFPLDTDTYNIHNIKDKMTPDYFVQPPQNHFLDVEIYCVKDGVDKIMSSGNSDNEIKLRDCIPYRTASPPYPYNLTDPFFSNHSCCNGDPLTPEQVGWGTKKIGTVCYSNVEYGCRDSAEYRNFTTLSNPFIPITYDVPPDLENNDVYKREFTRKCKGDRGNKCEGEMADTRTRIQECEECQYCSYGNQSCQNLPFGNVCNSDFICTDGEGSAYVSGTGDFLCQSSCKDGVCGTSINCDCDKSICDAECENSDYTDYIWDDKQCIFNCNNQFEGVIIPDCKYHNNTGPNFMKCSSPDMSDSSCETKNLIPGEDDFEVCPSDSSTSVIDSEASIYASYCRYDDRCYIVTCSGDGVYEIPGENCSDSGEMVDVPDTTRDDECYYNPTGEVECNSEAECEEHMPFSDILNKECDTGSPIDGNCTDNNKCYNTTCNPLNGWWDGFDEEFRVVSGDYTCGTGSGEIRCDNGYDREGDFCLYNIACTQDGWIALDEYKISCTFPKVEKCTNSGWKCM